MSAPDHVSRIEGPAGIELSVVAGLEAPHSPEGEEMLICAVLADETPGAWALACNLGVKAGAFFDVKARTVWSAIDTLRRRGEVAVDSAVIAQHLQDTGKLEEVGGVYGVMQLTAKGRVATSAHVRFFAESLKLLWDRRHALACAEKLRLAALEAPNREEFVKNASELGQKLIRLGRKEQAQTLAEVYADMEEEARARINGTVDKSRWVLSGLEPFEIACRPFGSAREDHYTVVCGGSGFGKSVVLRQIAAANLKAGKRILFYTRETSAAGLVEMMVAAEQAIDLNTLEQLPKDFAARFYGECERQRTEWADKLLFVVQHTEATPLHTVEDVCDHARAFVNLHGKPNAIMVDYLQLLDARKRITGNSREAVVAYVSHQLQALTRELDVPVIVAAQMNEAALAAMREVKKDADGKIVHRMPRPGDLRESQAAYHDADRVIFLYRPPEDCCGRDQTVAGVTRPEMWWYQEKRRRGCAGIYVRTWFEKRFTRFVAMNPEERTASERAEIGARKVLPGQRVSKADFKRGVFGNQ